MATEKQRFFDKVNKTETCWLWTGYYELSDIFNIDQGHISAIINFKKWSHVEA